MVLFLDLPSSAIIEQCKKRFIIALGNNCAPQTE